MSIEYKNKNKKINQSNNKTVINDKSINRYKLKKNYSENIKILPPINQNNNNDNNDNNNIDIVSKVKKSSLSRSISYLYQSLFPDEKHSMEHFLNNYSYNKFLKKPNWKYTFSRYKDEEKIKKNLMKKNTIMMQYNKMKSPCKLKKEFKRKPRIVEIIEDNYIYKNRILNNPFEDHFSISTIKNKIEASKNENERYPNEREENEEEDEGEFINDNKNIYIIEERPNVIKSRNKINFNNIYRENISCFVKNKINLPPI